VHIESINPLYTKNWNDLLNKNDEFSIFLSSEWARVLVNSYKYKPFYLVLKKKDELGALIPFMEVRNILNQRSGVSLPFSDVCHPVITEKINPDKIIERTIEYAKHLGWHYIDFHGGEKLFGTATPSVEYCGHRLELNHDINKTFSTFRSNTRRNIRKALQSNVQIHINESSKLLDDFYYLHCLTRRRHGLPVQPYSFFRNIYDQIIAKDLGILMCALYQGKTIASAVFFHMGNRALFKFGASDMQYQHLRANNLLMWEAIKRYCKDGYKSFNFGRTDIDQEGLCRYKSGWGTTGYPIKYFRYNLKKEQFLEVNSTNFYSMIKIIFGKMPIGLPKNLSRLFYKHFA
jgi:hypothetical protein